MGPPECAADSGNSCVLLESDDFNGIWAPDEAFDYLSLYANPGTDDELTISGGYTANAANLPDTIVAMDPEGGPPTAVIQDYDTYQLLTNSDPVLKKSVQTFIQMATEDGGCDGGSQVWYCTNIENL
ncbi:hypothetical protein FIP56_06515 [Francisella sp. LA112445]|nr:hypothetical protein FIP56_06515 [Francisella sp. LA112445]